MSDFKFNRNVGEFEFSMYDDDDEVYIINKRMIYDYGLNIPVDELVAFRDALNQIINELGLNDLKQIDQTVFENLPPQMGIVKSAAVDGDGRAWGWSTEAESLRQAGMYHRARRPAMQVWYFGDNYDTTNWQESAINREPPS